MRVNLTTEHTESTEKRKRSFVVPRWISVLSVVFLSSCFNMGSDLAVVQAPSTKKQRQKIAVLQKKLEQAEKEQKKVQGEVERLSSELDTVKLALIRKQVDQYEKKKEKSPNLFLEERESLYQMIQTGPSPTSFDAQVELDRILRIITELSDETKTS